MIDVHVPSVHVYIAHHWSLSHPLQDLSVNAQRPHCVILGKGDTCRCAVRYMYIHVNLETNECGLDILSGCKFNALSERYQSCRLGPGPTKNR